jgi:hypothetical protein
MAISTTRKHRKVEMGMNEASRGSEIQGGGNRDGSSAAKEELGAPEAWAEADFRGLDRAELRQRIFDGLTASRGSLKFGGRLEAAARRMEADWQKERHEPTFDARMGQVDLLRTATRIFDGAEEWERAARAAVGTIDALERALEAAPDIRRRSEAEHWRHEMVGVTLQPGIGGWARGHADTVVARGLDQASGRDASHIGRQPSFEGPLAVYAAALPPEQAALSEDGMRRAHAALEAREKRTTEDDPLAAIELRVDRGRLELTMAEKAYDPDDADSLPEAKMWVEGAIARFQEAEAGGYESRAHRLASDIAWDRALRLVPEMQGPRGTPEFGRLLKDYDSFADEAREHLRKAAALDRMVKAVE